MKYDVLWSFTITVEAEDKHEATAKARTVGLADDWNDLMAQILTDDPLDVVELDENGDPIQ